MVSFYSRRYGQPTPLVLCGCWYVLPSHPYEQKYLPQVELDSSTTILSCTARTKLVQTFTNTDKSAISEAQYTFPLYDGVTVVSFKCTIGDRTIHGIVKEKQQARTDYKEAIERGETAGLLEQFAEAGDVFTTKIGNIPSAGNVVVEIVYLGELKHDAEKDGIRFTIPTAIAPRYGSMSRDSQGTMFGLNQAFNKKGIKILVDVAVEEGAAIRGLQSPSHPIAVTLGRNSIHDEEIFHNNLASASLALSGKTELDQDFVIVVNAHGQDTPRAFFETHDALRNQRALMTTLVPKFNLPNANPEIVFVVDRSGSMAGTIPLVVQALKIFLKSLPTSVKFNICSFGSKHSFLFKKSRSYDEASLNEALQHLDTFDANYGGTEMLAPFKECVSRRLKGTPLNIMILTDGEIWNQDELFGYVDDAAKDKVRVFSLGIGSGASSSLVEGIARAGDGFAQFVYDGEQIDKRVVRMLKAALMPVIQDYSLEVVYGPEGEGEDEDDGFTLVESFTESLKIIGEDVDLESKKSGSEKPESKKKISLFNINFKEEKPKQESAGRYDHLPSILTPTILQAPNKIPQLYPFNRTTIYLLFGPDSCQRCPQKVVLRGTSEHGPLELEIPVQNVGKGEMIHQLAAKKAIQDLEEGRGWISKATTSKKKPLKDQFEGDWDRIVEREAVKLGTRYQVAGKFCSFVAVEQKSQGGHADSSQAGGTAIDHITIGVEKSNATLSQAASQAPRARKSVGGGIFGAAAAPARALFKQSPSGAPRGGSTNYVMSNSYAPPDAARRMLAKKASPGFSSRAAKSRSSPAPPPPPAAAPASAMAPGSALFGGRSEGLAVEQKAAKPLLQQSQVAAFAAPLKEEESYDSVDEDLGDGGSRALISTPESKMHAIIDLQEFNGSWKKVTELLAIVGVTRTTFDSSLGVLQADEIKATVLAVAWFESRVASEKETWEMVADKARSWIASQGHGNVDELVRSAKDAFFA